MTKALLPHDKFYLRSLHREIDYYDRKIAYLSHSPASATPVDPKETEAKLITKRAALEKSARELAACGVEFNESDLPRSFRAEVTAATAASAAHPQP